MPVRKRSSLGSGRKFNSSRSVASEAPTPVVKSVKRRRLSRRLSTHLKTCQDEPDVKQESSCYTADEDEGEYWRSDVDDEDLEAHAHVKEEVPAIDLATPTPSVTMSEAEDASCEDYSNTEDVGDGQPLSRPLKLSAESLNKVQSIISQQFDLEIVLKHRELRAIEDEIAKTQVMMLQMRQYSESPSEVISGDPVDFVEKYTKFLGVPATQSRCSCSSSGADNFGIMSSDDLHYNSGSSYYHTRRSSLSSLPTKPTSSQPPSACLYKKTDGTVVRLVCPECQRGNFGSVQGFINHCRISHELEFTSHDAAASRCGVSASGDVVMVDDDARNAQRQRSYSSIAPDSSSPPSLPYAKHVEFASEISVSNPVKSGASEGRATTTTTTTTTTASATTTTSASGTTSTATATVSTNSNTNTKTKTESKQKTEESKLSRIANLAEFLRNNSIDLDLDELAAQATERVHKGYLFDGEEDFAEPEVKLAEEASTFERVLAEARKLNLNVDEIRAAGAQANKAKNEANEKRRKRKGSVCNRGSAVSRMSNTSGSGDDTKRDLSPSSELTKQPAYSKPPSPPPTQRVVSSLNAQANRRMPSEVKPLVTRSKARAQQKVLPDTPDEVSNQVRRPPTPPLAEETLNTSKRREMKMIGNFSKYIPRFF